ncbi:MAG: hypothetical protein M5U19_14045, partial [Microthrixaceae bacterium]|nr:hypothetical protein [Microthrixaceae bacterium]
MDHDAPRESASGVDLQGLKDRASSLIDDLADLLIGISHDLWEHPETALAEHHAHDLLTERLEAHGMDTRRSAYGLETAFEACGGTHGREVAVICEYDALPGIGHACVTTSSPQPGSRAGVAAAVVSRKAQVTRHQVLSFLRRRVAGKVLMAAEGPWRGWWRSPDGASADHDLSSLQTACDASAARCWSLVSQLPKVNLSNT